MVINNRRNAATRAAIVWQMERKKIWLTTLPGLCRLSLQPDDFGQRAQITHNHQVVTIGRGGNRHSINKL